VTDSARAGFEEYATANPQHVHGAHAYRAADVGLDPGELSARFAAYRDRYDVPAEPPD
jgi:hypothetical protein